MKFVLIVLVILYHDSIQSVLQRVDYSTGKTEKLGMLRLFGSNICPENQVPYPGKGTNEYICDCGPGYIYYPARDACFAAYRQGPCDKGEHLMLKDGDLFSSCVTNPCEDGFAKYNDTCYELGKPNGPCGPVSKGGGIFEVNATTLQPECLKGIAPATLFNLPRRCTPGSKRDNNGDCRVVYND